MHGIKSLRLGNAWESIEEQRMCDIFPEIYESCGGLKRSQVSGLCQALAHEYMFSESVHRIGTHCIEHAIDNKFYQVIFNIQQKLRKTTTVGISFGFM